MTPPPAISGARRFKHIRGANGLASVTFQGSLSRRSWKSSPKIEARASSSLSCWVARSSVPSAGVGWLLILLHGRKKPCPSYHTRGGRKRRKKLRFVLLVLLVLLPRNTPQLPPPLATSPRRTRCIARGRSVEGGIANQ